RKEKKIEHESRTYNKVWKADVYFQVRTKHFGDLLIGIGESQRPGDRTHIAEDKVKVAKEAKSILEKLEALFPFPFNLSLILNNGTTFELYYLHRSFENVYLLVNVNRFVLPTVLTDVKSMKELLEGACAIISFKVRIC